MNINNASSEASWFTDCVHGMHQKYGFHEAVKDFTPEQKKQLLKFRIDFLKEELDETILAYENGDAEELVDGHIDLIVVALGTLDIFDVDIDRAWQVVHGANMQKKRGIKEGRPNPLGLPDLTKPEGWTAPSHEDNHGNLHDIPSDKG